MPKYKANILLDNEGWLVVQPLTPAASAFYAKNTWWAIGPKGKSMLNSFFEHYTKKGPIFIVVNKQEKEDGDMKKLGIHFESETYVKPSNENFNPKDFFDANPKVFYAIEPHMTIEGEEMYLARFS